MDSPEAKIAISSRPTTSEAGFAYVEVRHDARRALEKGIYVVPNIQTTIDPIRLDGGLRMRVFNGVKEELKTLLTKGTRSTRMSAVVLVLPRWVPATKTSQSRSELAAAQ